MPSFHDQLRQILVEAKMADVPVVDTHHWLNMAGPFNVGNGERALAALRHSISGYKVRYRRAEAYATKVAIKLTPNLGHYTHYQGPKRDVPA